MSGGLGVAGLLILFGTVAFGSILPVLPTGAAVSAAAVLAQVERPWELVLVLLFGAAGAYVGDIVSYAVLWAAGPRLAQRVGWLRAADPDGALARIRAGIEAHELRTLLLSRLVPGGRIPVLLAASLGGYPWIRFATADIAASLLWSAAYSAIGIIGNSLLPNQTVALVVVIVVAILSTAVAQLVQRTRQRP